VAGAAAIALVMAAGGFVIGQRSQPDTAKAEPRPASALAEEEPQADDGAIELSAQQITAAGIEVVAVKSGGGAETRLSGRVQPMTDAKAAITANLSGAVERLLVAPGQAVRAGQPIATVVSGEGAALKADTEAAAAAATAARQAHQRNVSLAEQGVIARQEVEASQAQAASASALARAARARASAAGSPSASGRASIVSPISGVITNVQVGPGGFVTQGTVLAEVTNPNRVELVLTRRPQWRT